MYKISSDHYFHIGYAHLLSGKPAQDYALSGVYNSVGFATISDGCSTGGHTDVGARLISLSVRTAVREYLDLHNGLDIIDWSLVNEVDMRQKIVLQGIRQTLGLELEDLLATSIYALSEENQSVVHVLGDGVVAIKYRDGRIVMSNFEWHDNTPFYPVYRNGLLDNFIKSHGCDISLPRLTETIWVCDDDSCKQEDIIEYTLKEGIDGITILIEHSTSYSDVEFIAIFSDGVTQIDGVEMTDAVCELMRFKSLKGEFVKRRLIAGIKKFKKIGKGPLDDIACAVLQVNQ